MNYFPDLKVQLRSTQIPHPGFFSQHSVVWFHRSHQNFRRLHIWFSPCNPNVLCFFFLSLLCQQSSVLLEVLLEPQHWRRQLTLHTQPTLSRTATMDEISWLLENITRVRSDSLCSDATQSSSSKLALRHRLIQLMTYVDDLDSNNELHEKVGKTLDNAFFICGKRSNKLKKDSFRWWITLSPEWFSTGSLSSALFLSFLLLHLSLMWLHGFILVNWSLANKYAVGSWLWTLEALESNYPLNFSHMLLC